MVDSNVRGRGEEQDEISIRPFVIARGVCSWDVPSTCIRRQQRSIVVAGVVLS